VLVAKPDAVHESLWVQEVHRDMAVENVRKGKHKLPAIPIEAEYQIESIRAYVHRWNLNVDYPSMRSKLELLNSACASRNMERSRDPTTIKPCLLPLQVI
jgi:hypothetical protein